jgi:mono/diheme cytochrome c family protein
VKLSPHLRSLLVVVTATLLLGAVLSWDVISDVMHGSPALIAPTTGPAAAPQPTPDGARAPEVLREGARVFGAQCGACHGPHADWPIATRLRGRTRDEFYALLDYLPAVNPVMPGFQGTDDERSALAAYLASLPVVPGSLRDR